MVPMARKELYTARERNPQIFLKSLDYAFVYINKYFIILSVYINVC